MLSNVEVAGVPFLRGVQRALHRRRTISTQICLVRRTPHLIAKKPLLSVSLPIAFVCKSEKIQTLHLESENEYFCCNKTSPSLTISRHLSSIGFKSEKDFRFVMN